MDKREVIKIAEAMGFHLDYDQWDDKGWIRLELQKTLDEPNLRWIWYKGSSDDENLGRVAQILFKAGQKWAQINFQRIDSLPISY